MSYNEKLLELYRTYWEELSMRLETTDSNDFGDPFLISIDEEIVSQDVIKVMIFGQETRGWNPKEGGRENSLSKLMERYRGYFKGEKSIGSFWRGFSFFEKTLTQKFPEKKFHFVWNNISKIGRSGKRTGVSAGARKLERDYFSVVSGEVKIFNPDVVIFFTGPNRNGDIRHHFEDAKFSEIGSEFSCRELAKVSSSKLPKNTIRMYHPSYFGGFNKTRDVAIAELLNSIARDYR
ncbi:MAG: hypothetical protein KKH61_21060 [Gammaproteobacteria bacterium]|nr:hypothetical protein [Gammaproteobacteria bacterium]